ncbi:hypothetical protein ACFFTM_01750 [Pseudoduganella plicata]|uniref:Uncharacterized protein n=1 Tax=Pseudoduganella plicata TaxID=321984 RepID=A0AA87Y6C2_9BURK|nr:hypothetical protein [Pseudoduganella plicata]GGY73125.1 hypothetical protein GCM10007388_01490 [Pseudoduganella plicata]
MPTDYTDAELLESIRELLNDEVLLAEFMKLCNEIRADIRAHETSTHGTLGPGKKLDD